MGDRGKPLEPNLLGGYKMKISEVIKFLEGMQVILGDIDITTKGNIMPDGSKMVSLEFPKISIQIEEG